MRFAVISDLHLGFARGTERESDAFLQAKQALEIAVGEKVDCILMPGDLFDDSIPRQEVWHEVFQLLSIPLNAEKSKVRIVFKARNETEKGFKFDGIPVIALHGTHEFRGKDFKNALEVLHSANFLLHLHSASAIVEKNDERVCVQGLSGIPEKKALDALRLWNPKPLPDCKNVLMLHQSIKEFLPTDDEMSATISLADLPKGFDLIVNGHLHWSDERKINSGTSLLIPGSTVITQCKKLESEKPKGFFVFDSLKNTCEFFEIPLQRRLYYHKIKFENCTPEQALKQLKEVIEKDLQNSEGKLAPLIRLKCTGVLAKGFQASDISFTVLEEKFKGKAVLSLEKDFETESFKKTIAELREQQKQKKSISQVGLELLETNLQETQFNNAFDCRRVFDLLAEGSFEKAIQVILKGNK